MSSSAAACCILYLACRVASVQLTQHWLVGMGKTTFIQNLFAAYAQDPNLKVAGVAGPTSKQVLHGAWLACSTAAQRSPASTRSPHTQEGPKPLQPSNDSLSSDID